MGKSDRFDAFAVGTGEKAKKLLNKAIQVVDQTDDGKFNFDDVAVIAENVRSAVKKGAQEKRRKKRGSAKKGERKKRGKDS